MKNFLITLIIVALLGTGIYFLFFKSSSVDINLNNNNDNTNQTNNDNQASTTDQTITDKNGTEIVLGKSFGGRDISAYQYGNGTKEILLVGGVHGGYAWNTSLLAYELMDYLKTNPEAIPVNVTVTIIPVLNPDGLNKVAGDSDLSSLMSNPPALASTVQGRFNGNEVDLNRNFDCDWKKSGTWQNKTVSGGDEPFSEPEAQAIKNYVENENPTAVVVWYSAAGGVFSSSCGNGILPETKTLTNIYGSASGYPTYETFSSYEVNGDMVNWLAKKNIPAISVLLTDHNNTELSKNKAGIEAILNSFAE